MPFYDSATPILSGVSFNLIYILNKEVLIDNSCIIVPQLVNKFINPLTDTIYKEIYNYLIKKYTHLSIKTLLQ